MFAPIDEATSQFLEAAADDLQRQLGIVGTVDGIEARPTWDAVTIVVTIRVGKKTAVVEGSGDDVVTAYADLRQHLAEPALIAATRNLYDSLTI